MGRSVMLRKIRNTGRDVQRFLGKGAATGSRLLTKGADIGGSVLDTAALLGGPAVSMNPVFMGARAGLQVAETAGRATTKLLDGDIGGGLRDAAGALATAKNM